MELTIFAKKRTSADGKPFYGYLATMEKKDGSKMTVSVKFRDVCGSPKPDKCPMNVIINKQDANLSSRDFVREDTGEMATSWTLWVSSWQEGCAYVDHSLDDFVD